MSGFDYPYTCGEIDDAREEVLDVCEDFIAERFHEGFREHMQEHFDGFRTINSNMRDEAESQIVTLEERVEELEAELKGFEE